MLANVLGCPSPKPFSSTSAASSSCRRTSGARRAGATPISPPAELLDRGALRGCRAARHRDRRHEWPHYWDRYLDGFLTACDVPDELRASALEHLASEHAVAALWSRIAPGSREGLQALTATGVRIGIISNSDGTVEQQLREHEVAQWAPGPASRSSASSTRPRSASPSRIRGSSRSRSTRWASPRRRVVRRRHARVRRRRRTERGPAAVPRRSLRDAPRLTTAIGSRHSPKWPPSSATETHAEARSASTAASATGRLRNGE